MEPKLIELAISKGAFVLIVGIALFMIRSLIKYIIDLDLGKKLEEIKKEAAKENITHTQELNKGLEEYKSQLDLLKQQSNVQFNHLHLERAGVIRDLYAHLVELHSAMVDFTRTIHWVQGDADKEEVDRLDRFNTALNTFKNFYLPRKLYLEKRITAQLDDILQKYWTEAYDFDLNKRLLRMRSGTKESNTIHNEKLNAISERVIKDFPPIVSQIEDEFRKILGVKD